MAQSFLMGQTDQMEAFNPTPPDPAIATAHEQQAGSGGAQGGMAEGNAYRAADRQATMQLANFLTQAAQGVKSYSATARACSQDYQSGDSAAAQNFVGAMNMSSAN